MLENIRKQRRCHESLQTSKMESFAIVAKLSILDVCGGPGYASGKYLNKEEHWCGMN